MLFVGSGIGALAVLSVVGWWLLRKDQTPSPITPIVRGEQEQTTPVARDIDGVVDTADKAKRYPVGVMIENLSTIRPQAGLEYANVIYEALVEGGITRFLAVYTLPEIVERIGPVRSARPYYLDLVKEYDALYAHVGGSPEAMAKIREFGLRDIDQFFNPQYYWRDLEVTPREHTVFTASKFLIFALRDKNAPAESTFQPWTFKDDAELTDRPEAEQRITIEYSTFNYRVDWLYDRSENVYQRSHGDVPHTTTNGKRQSAKNVIVQYVKTSLADAGRLRMEMTGEGKAIVFRDGVAVTGTWRKADREARTTFFDDAGKELPLNAGQTWVEIVPTDRRVHYTGQPEQ